MSAIIINQGRWMPPDIAIHWRDPGSSAAGHALVIPDKAFGSSIFGNPITEPAIYTPKSQIGTAEPATHAGRIEEPIECACRCTKYGKRRKP